MRLLPFKNNPIGEVRPAYFLQAFNRPVENMQIVSFGRCNFNCPYCKRNGQYIDQNGNIFCSREFTEQEIFTNLDQALKNGNRIRLSGGDPCMHIKDSLSIANYAKQYDQKISIAHNGSSPKFVESIIPFLEYAAIDLKAATPEELNIRAGLTNGTGKKMLENSLLIQTILSNSGILTDVRTCVFSTTTLDDLFKIADMIISSGNINFKFWTIRQYKPVSYINWKPLPNETIDEYINIIASEYPELSIGLRSKWEPGGFKIWNKRS